MAPRIFQPPRKRDLFNRLLGKHAAVKVPSGSSIFNDIPADYGFSHGVVYFVWALTVFTLYWPSRWYMNLKARHRDWWLSYF